MYSMYINASNNTPFHTHVSSYVVCKVQPFGCQPIQTHTRRPNTPRQFIVSQEHLMHEQMEKCNIHELVLHHQGHGESKPEIWWYTNHLHDQHYTKYDI